jgi:hypothetical protein
MASRVHRQTRAAAFYRGIVGFVAILFLSLPTVASALSSTSGHGDFLYGAGAASTSGTASAQNGTGMEAESKLFFTQDGNWWGVPRHR